jgi:HEAT repeats
MRGFAIAALTVTLLTSSAVAGPPDFPRIRSLFERKKKDEPAPARAKQLVDTLRSDPDEKKRKAAAEELAEYDPRGNAEVMAGLIASLRQDPAVSVRVASADTIGKLKPVSAQAGVALEEAVQADPSENVRKAAQGALFQYHLNGYKATATAATQSAEPPLAKAKSRAVTTVTVAKPPLPTPVPVSAPVTVGRGTTVPAQSPEPPLAKPKNSIPPTPVPTATEGTLVPAAIPGLPAALPQQMPNSISGIPTAPTVSAPGDRPKG